MPEANITVSQIHIKVGGTELDNQKLTMLQEALVDQNSHLPHMFLLRFRDPGARLIDDPMFDPPTEIEIDAETDSGAKASLFKGEVTSIEPHFRSGMIADLVVRGYDKTHRLYREVKSRAFLNKKDSQLAQEIAGEHGLAAQVDTTNTVYDHIYQYNQSDLTFLMGRAWRIGYECFVEDGRLYFRKPPSSGTTVTLEWGSDLLSFQPTMTLAEQVDEVTVKGWDMMKQEAIVGKATTGKLYPAVGLSKNGAEQASVFGAGKKIIVDQPVVSQAEADLLAEARLNEISGSFIQARGLAFRRPDIRAGQFVELKSLGSRFSGKYLVTSARHIYSDGGLQTEFEVRGTRSGLLGEQMTRQEPRESWPGAVVAVVTDANDPENLGRVKVKYPWMTNDADSFWARIISAGAGPETGLFMVPEVGDEVMVIFEHGDFNRPYVLGGLWNGQHAIPPPGAGAANNEKPKVRTWHSRTGHHISVYDNADNKVEIVTAGGHSLTLDDKNKKIELVTSGGQKLLVDDQGNSLTLETAGTFDIKSTGNLTLKSSANVKIEAGGMMDITASGPLNLKGAVVNIN